MAIDDGFSRNEKLVKDAKAGKFDRIGSSAERKNYPICTGFLDYFPDALLEAAYVSKVGNDQHNPGEPLHWAKEKSIGDGNEILRHLIDRGKRDVDGTRHSAKLLWRAAELLQREIDAECLEKAPERTVETGTGVSRRGLVTINELDPENVS